MGGGRLGVRGQVIIVLFPAIPQFGHTLGPPVPQQIQGQGAAAFVDLQDQQAGSCGRCGWPGSPGPLPTPNPPVASTRPPGAACRSRPRSAPLGRDDRQIPAQGLVAGHEFPQLAVVIQILFAIQDVADLFLADPDGKIFGSPMKTLLPE